MARDDQTPATGLRVLGRVRLSRFKDESTSVERQQEIITTWAEAHGHQIIGWAVDTDVSRSVDPFNAPELGAWFRSPDKIVQWDVVACWKLDRIAAGSIYLNGVLKWCQDHNKTLMSVTENLDLSTWVGKMIANVIAGLAEGELEVIRERTSGSQEKLRTLGRWPGGVTHYGYFPVKTKEGWKLVLDPYSSEIVLSIFEEFLAGGSVQSIATRLNAEGVLTPRDYYRQCRIDQAEAKGEGYFGKQPEGKQWNPQSIFRLLTSKTFLGQVTHEGETVFVDGDAVLKAEALLSREEFDRIQAKVAGRRFTKTNNRTSQASPLLGVLLCLECESNMHHRGNTVAGKRYRYYYCPKKHGQSVVAEEFEGLFEKAFEKLVGNLEVFEKVYVPAINHTQQLDQAKQNADDLSAMLAGAKSRTRREDIMKQLTILDERIAELEDLPSQPARTELVATGKTYSAEWESSDTEARRQLLINAGIRVLTKVSDKGRSLDQPGTSPVEIHLPLDIHSRLGAGVTTDWRDLTSP